MNVYTMTVQVRVEAESEVEAEKYAQDFQFALLNSKKVNQERIIQVLGSKVNYYSTKEEHKRSIDELRIGVGND